jgi:hypothetical protein
MAVVANKSTAITNATATPRVLNSTTLEKGIVRRSIGLAVMAATDSVASTYRICRVPSSACLDRIMATTADIGTTGTFNLGFYYPTTHANGGTVIDDDCVADSWNFHGGAVNEEVTYEKSGTLYQSAELRVWQLAGLTSDPGIELDFVATMLDATDAAGTVLFKVYYVN